MATRRISPGAKVGVFVAILAVVSVALFLGWRAISGIVSGTDQYPEEIIAGESFEPGATVEVYGTETTAVIDGVTQQVQAQDPSEDWLEALPEASCDDTNVCTAPAPNSAAAPLDTDGGDGAGDQNFFESLLARFGITGSMVSSLAGGLLVVYIIYVLSDEQK